MLWRDFGLELHELSFLPGFADEVEVLAAEL